ncbi:hypothetical protein H9Y04_22605 [Streptomyces sp. TRM66268-LWL]|uniref:Lipoprotein n=1 Tax=Streptomyces polyasparticus TaxID=2767826 RepID=A0ABR7SKF2_9ACTN|nr:hypothetical protein [Streptomyces polyasparticus]MBC9715344.1 hypothetical protein [Streptomyces polyasparticus]
MVRSARSVYVSALAATVLALAVLSACEDGAEGRQRDGGPAKVSKEQAVEVLQRVARRAPAGSAREFCKSVLQRQACEDAWEESVRQRCLKPGGMPRVLRGAAVPDTRTSDGGQVLLVEGRTAGGGRYVSEFFVTAPEGRPVASLGVFWSGLGLGNSPLGEGVQVLPGAECARD